MVITDVPQSGIYFQQGAVVQLVVQIVDANTGLPVLLQAASGLSLAFLYPDLSVSEVFPAQLYTDGSDGKIVYTTVNTGNQIDLSEIGLYKMQGQASVGGVPMLSYETDFYVLSNTFGGVFMPIATPSAVVMFDNSNIRWVGTVSTAGVLSWVAQSSGPPTFLQFNSLIMKDDTGTYWTMSISTLGVVTGTSGGNFPHAIDKFTLVDANGKSWIITASEIGQLVPS
jgi:hypothetical protein